MDAAHDIPVSINIGGSSLGHKLEVESGYHQDYGTNKAENATTEDARREENPGDESNESKSDQQKTAAKPMDLESEIHDLKAKLADLITSQDQLKERDYDDSFTMPAEHKFELQRRRYSAESSDSGSDDYTQFDHRRRRMERVLVRELKDLRREKEMIKDIRVLRRDRDDLVEKEREWEKERRKLERVRKQLKRGAHFSRVEVAGLEYTEESVKAPETDGAPLPSGGLEEGEVTAHTPPTFSTPRLNYVDWSTFKALREDAQEDSCAIDVLRGEPVITFDHTNYWWKKKSERGRGKGDELGKGKPSVNVKKKQALLPEQAHLPERIRIHSKQIVKFLDKVSGENLSSHTDSVVMIRPYKFLVCYEDQIRQRFQKLHAKFGEHVVTAHLDAAKASHAAKEPIEDIATTIADQDGLGNSDAGPTIDKPRDSSLMTADKDDGDLDAEEKSPMVYEQVGCLMKFMDTEIRKKLEYLTSNKCDRVPFTDLWYLFKPGDEVIDQNHKQAYRVIEVASVSHKVVPPWQNYYDVSSGKSDQTPVYIHCVYVDFDGKNIGPVSKVFEIPRYDGDRAVTSLDIYPLRFAENDRVPNGSFRQKLVARGRMFLDVAEIRHMHYAGLTLDARDEVDSQVVVDFEEAFAAKGNTEWRPTVERLIGASKIEKVSNEPCVAECCRDENIHKDTDAETQRNRDYIASLIPEDRNKYPSVAVYPRTLGETKSADNALVDEELVIMSYRVFGFVLRSRKWALLDLTFLSSISFKSSRESVDQLVNEEVQQEKPPQKQETAFDQLVLPEGHKKMVLSLIAQHFRDKESGTTDTEQVDIVRGKGKGLILLLHGAPGVGKTTTAEGVAEMFQKPLFQITCGDLGVTAKEVEETLERNFTLANRWDCILLLDEADVFLTARSRDDFIRNGLVAVFLRVLEYYAGVLFLTTNRIGDFDEAFTSRIHISLYYPPLDLISTLEVFKLNLKLIRKRFTNKDREIKIDDDSILKFAKDYWTDHEKIRWNGRQIRNGCQTALALAEFDAQGGSHERVKDAHAAVKLQVEHLQIVSDAYRDFNLYLTKLYGKDSDRRAKESRIRAREMDAIKDDGGVVKDGTLLSHQRTSSSLVEAARQAEPSPGPVSAQMNNPTPLVSSEQYPYPVYYQQPLGQMMHPLQPGPVSLRPQAVQQTTVSAPGPAQIPWQGFPPGSWQNIQPLIPAQSQYGNSQGFGWAPGASPQESTRDRNQQNNAEFMPPRTGK